MSFASTLIAWILQRRRSAGPGDSDLGEQTLRAALDGDQDDVPSRGCGWFVSSLELRAGLAVIEHDWLDLTVLPSVAPDIELVWC